MKTSIMFLKKNLSSYKNVFISIVLFLFTINIVSIFLLGMTSGLNEQVIDNDNLNILELYPKENQTGLTDSQIEEIKKIDGILDVYYTEGASIECIETSGDFDSTRYVFSIFKLDHKYLKYYGLPETENETYFYGNKEQIPNLQIGNSYKALKNDLESSEDVEFKITDCITVPNILERLIPGDISFTDPSTFDKLLKNCDSFYINDSEYELMLQKGSTIHLLCPDVTKQNMIAAKIRDSYPNIKVSYVLESAVKLPEYVDTLIKIGIVLLVILLLFYFFSIKNNISNIIDFRAKGIYLFHVLGVETNKIVKSFYMEFIVLSVFSWLLQMLLTCIVIFTASFFLNVEIYKTPVILVSIGNVILLFLSMGLEGFFSIRKNIFKIINK